MIILKDEKGYFKEGFFDEIFEIVCENENISKEKELSLSVISTSEMKDLNNKYRGKNANTDVLSFPFEDISLPILGDIFLNISYVDENRIEPLDIALKKTFLHGLLHILGYDHFSLDEREKMEKKERFYTKKLGL